MMLKLIVAILFIILSFSIFAFVPIIIGAPFEPTRKKELDKMLKIVKIPKNKKIVDLGSGNGKLVIAFAKKGYECHGYEVNPWLVLLTKYYIWKNDLKGKAFVHWGNFWRKDMSEFDVVILFQIYYIMPKLEKKLKKEMKKNSLVISNKWEFPNLKPFKKNEKIRVYKI
jgi:ribosomal protein L11 methylase PrmA